MIRAKSYQKTDVLIFKEIFEKQFFCKTKSIDEEKVKEHIRNLYRTEITIPGLDCHIQTEIDKLNIQEFGFKTSNDFEPNHIREVFSNSTKIILEPKTVYFDGDKLGIPEPEQIEKALFLMFISDTFERLKVKVENVIKSSYYDKHIELYAKKNIQVLGSIFEDSLEYMKAVCIKEENFKFFRIYVLNTYIYHTILYYQNRFSNFYSEEKHKLNSLRMDLVDSIGIHTILEPMFSYGELNESETETQGIKPFVWKDQINVLATLFYDLRKVKLINASDKDIIDFICEFFVDKNGKKISRNTIRICLYDYRSDKRASGSKRIDVKKYL